MFVTENGILFNSASDTQRAHSHADLDNVMHIFDAYWHGIRSAAGCLPGHKVAISHKNMVNGDGIYHLFSYIAKFNIRHIVFQAYSNNAHELALLLKSEFGSSISLYVITHVSPSQFENQFEMVMIKRMVDGLASGLFKRLGAVKPRFSGVIPCFWGNTIINSIPKLPMMGFLRDVESVLVPVENHWRKNFYTNMLAAVQCEEVKTVYSVNAPTGLEHINDLSKVKTIGFLRPPEMLARSASCGVILHASLIECQPMTQLEGLAVGTPCITGHLGVHTEIDRHPLSRLCEVEFVDDVGAIVDTLRKLITLSKNDPAGLKSMIIDQIALRNRLGAQSYLDFIS